MSQVTKSKYKPTIKDILHMPLLGSSKISPDGKKIIYFKRILDNTTNQYKTFTFIVKLETKEKIFFTSDKTVKLAHWLSNNSISLLKMTDNNFQIYVYQQLFGEGVKITNFFNGVVDYKPFGNGFIFLANNPNGFLSKRKNKYGNFIHVEKDSSDLNLYYTELKSTENFLIGHYNFIDIFQKNLKNNLFIESYFPSPDGRLVFVNCHPKPDVIYEFDYTVYKIKFSSSENIEISKFDLPKNSKIEAVSPDGLYLLYRHWEEPVKSHIQSDLWVRPIDSDKSQLPKKITENLDQEPIMVYWTCSGIFISYWDHSVHKIARLTTTGEIFPIDLKDLSIERYFHVNDNGDISFVGNSTNLLPEIYFFCNDGSNTINCLPERPGTENWDYGTVELIKWKSRDKTEIEGILHKPTDFDPNKRYPLIIHIHGGPSASYAIIPYETSNIWIYPNIQFVNKGIIILKPNYRGSFGRGKEFLKLNENNLGIGDQWDIESGVDFLITQGFIDKNKIGVMGWRLYWFIFGFSFKLFYSCQCWSSIM
jgi:dipeptidyl aminopeptidase/acylaminoacyl peptidase